MYDEVGMPRATRPKPINPLLPAAVATEIISPATPEPQPEPRGLAAGNIDSVTVEGSPPKLIDKLENMTPALIQKTLEYYEKQIVTAPVENAIIITTTGEIYHCTGDLNTLDSIIKLGKRLEGSHITHNHPVGSVNEYTFGGDDEMFFVKFKPARLRGIDEKFLYELNRNATDNELAGYELHELYSLGLDFEDPHVVVTLWAVAKGFGYWRKPR